MTKKSAARLMRDARQAEIKRQLQNNECWTELEGIRNNCVAMMVNYTSVGAMANQKELVACVDDIPTLLTNLTLFKNDLVKLNEELKEIGAKHEGKTGGSQDPDEVMASIEIYELYILWQERHDAIFVPTVMHVLEQFQQAEAKLLAKRLAAAEQQPGEGEQNNIDPAVAPDRPVGEILKETLEGVATRAEQAKTDGEESGAQDTATTTS